MSFFQTSKMMMTAAVIIGFAASPSLAATFNAAADFSTTNNPNGVWQYGWSSSLGSTFNLYPNFTNDAGFVGWRDPSITYFSAPTVVNNNTGSPINVSTVTLEPGLTFHPGFNGQYSIVRWTAPEDGTYSLATKFAGADFVGPTTTDVHVLHNGISLFNDLVNGFGASSAKLFTNTLFVNAGDTIDFAVGYGNGNFYSDSTSLAATISSATPPESVPEPGSALGLLVFGTFGAGFLLKRKQQQLSQDSSIK
ncbi:PEP-CTERM sorting domain-containing protein [Microseira wollei]|nr:PEP-CTERM sorting domain-containing protein [Microseira wollei]